MRCVRAVAGAVLHWSNTAPAHSPPSAMPCTKRSATSRTGASTPILRVGGQKPDQRRADAHHEQRDHEHVAPAATVAQVSEQDAAERTRQVADPVRRERQQVPVSGSTDGKNSLLNTSAASVL
jgi:hypothetical protein